jgi:hypothetical protein
MFLGITDGTFQITVAVAEVPSFWSEHLILTLAGEWTDAIVYQDIGPMLVFVVAFSLAVHRFFPFWFRHTLTFSNMILTAKNGPHPWSSLLMFRYASGLISSIRGPNI